MRVEDHGLATAHETKYTVDTVGNELMLYTDNTTARERIRDRVSIARNSIVASLPRQLRDVFVHGANATNLDTRPWSWRLTPRIAGSGRAAYDIGDDHSIDADASRAHVMQVLRRSTVPAAVMPAGPGKPASIIIADSHLDRACAALAGNLDRSWRMMSLDSSTQRDRKISASRLLKAATRRNGFRLFQKTAGAPFGVDAAIFLEVWARRETNGDRSGLADAESESALVSLRRQAWTTHLTESQWQEAVNSGKVDIGDLDHLFDVAAPIDVVYTWVDGSDPVWNHERLKALGLPESEDAQEASTHAARFRSHDELRYSMRSLEAFAPWVRRIYIVTAGQTPHWLDTEHPQIRVVDHREIFTDPNVLPVFNSHAIESQLHHIPGLSEQYLYMNDDVFFGRPVSPSLFFHGNGLAKFFKSSALIDAQDHHAGDVPVMSAAKNNRQLITDVFGRQVTNLFQHTPHPQLRSVLKQMESEHPDAFNQVASSTFRHPDDLSISSALHHYYAYALGKAVPGRLAYMYLDLAHPRAASRLRRLLRRREFDVICLNDSPEVGAEGRREMLQQFLGRYYPTPSSFELSEDTVRSTTDSTALATDTLVQQI